MMYIQTSIPREQGMPGAPIAPRDSLTLINVRDVAYMPSRDSSGVYVPEDIILKKDRCAITIYMTPGTVEVTEPLDGETDQEGFTPAVKFNHPGNSRKVREFKTNNAGEKFIIIVRYCSGQPADILGDLCNPMKMTASYTGNNTSSTNEFTFTQSMPGKGIGIYGGTVPEEEPVAVVPAKAAKVDYLAEGQYQLSAGAASLTAIEGGSDGAVVTLLGVNAAAAECPVVTAGAKLLLAGGRDFTASDGSQLTLRAFDAGGDALVWIEQSRYEV
ncbi:MAG: hypothetical protein K2F74_06855 [Muribaculaceae bacterium]|nr:hypothetical protein [Muribaculaceae bacterium]MDE6131295.1 hypothetical protein [Muribaculaceae bacterium]